MPDIVIQTKKDGAAVNGLTDDPEITITRLDTDAVVVNADTMSDQGVGGLYKYAFEPVAGLNYSFFVDADPNVTDQVDDRNYFGGFDNDITYEEAAVWIDSQRGTAGTRQGINGTQDNPVTNFADARVIADALGIRRFKILECNETLTQSYQNWDFVGLGPSGVGGTAPRIIDLNGQNCSGSKFENMFISGDAATPGAIIRFNQCALNNVTNVRAQADFCGLQGTISLAPSTQPSFFHQCYSRTAGGATPTINVQGGDLNLRAYTGGIQLRGATAGSAVSLEFIAGQCILNADNTGGDIQIRGVVSPVTDNSAGATVTQVAAVQGVRIDDVWQNEGMDIANPKTITENTVGADYDEAVGTINKDVTKVGSVTTIQRTT